MPNYQLKSDAEIATITASPDYAGLTAARMKQLQMELLGAANELDAVLPELLRQANGALERDYLRAMINYAAPVAEGARLPQGGGFVLNSYSENSDKLAASSVNAGDHAVITGEANRIEKYLGGGIGSDANWLVLRNTVALFVANAGQSQISVNGVACGIGTTTYVGWVDPTAVLVVSPFGFSESESNEVATASVLTYVLHLSANANFAAGERIPLPIPFGPREATVTLTLAPSSDPNGG